MHQVINACSDDEWNYNTHQLGNQQTEKARHKRSFVASQIRSEWAERTQHQMSLAAQMNPPGRQREKLPT
jgi:hypothetical protein